MRYERSKAPLALMEQIIMILVFALAAAVCLQAFVYSNNLSVKGERENNAVSHAQEVAEYCKMYSGNLDEVQEELAGERTQDGLRVFYEEDQMTVVLAVKEQTDWLAKARVCVLDHNEQEIYSLNTAWQRGGHS